MSQIVIASHNQGKLREFDAMRHLMSDEFSALNTLEFIPITRWAGEPPEETGHSFIANALIKARAAAALSGLPAIADDSGLEVAALGGAPGIFSARYAGINATDSENNALLLAELSAAPSLNRSAQFVCALVFVRDATDTAPLTAYATWAGEILTTPQGAHGFGYDPLFFLPGLGKSAAELPAELKNRISHRAFALAQLLTQLGSHPL
jgi:XTP/dITP diphosphohydrolase